MLTSRQRFLFNVYRLRADLVALCALIATALLSWSYPAAHIATVPIDTPSAFLPTNNLYRWEAFEHSSGGFRWTNGSGTITLPNPGRTVYMQMQLLGSNPKGTYTRMQTGVISTTFIVASSLRNYHILLPPSNGERFSVTLSSPTVRINKRGIGVAFSDVALVGAAMPLRLLPALLLASIGGYAFVRRAGARILVAAGAVLALQCFVAVWHAADGWRYGLLGGALFGLGAACLAAVALESVGARSQEPGVRSQEPARVWSNISFVYPVLIVLGIALLVRVPLLLAPDPVGDLELSARRMGFLYTRGLRGAFDNSGDYMPLRLLILWLFAQVNPLLGGTFTAPLRPATQLLIKLPGLLADLATIALVFSWVRRCAGTWRATLITLLYALAPPVWINVAWWGQVDALLLLPLVVAVLFLEHSAGRWSWLCWAAALLIKAQAIVIAPILFVVTVRRYGCRGLLRNATLAAALFGAVCLPFFLAGEGTNLAQAYLGSVERFPRTSFGAYNLWHVLLAGDSVRDTLLALGPWSYRQIGVALIGTATLVICATLVQRDDAITRVRATAVLMLAFFVLPTQIHERYLFLCLVWVCLCIAADARFALPFLVLTITATLNILGVLSGFVPVARAFIETSALPMIAAMINVVVLVGMLASLFWKRMPAPTVDG